MEYVVIGIVFIETAILTDRIIMLLLGLFLLKLQFQVKEYVVIGIGFIDTAILTDGICCY